LKVINSLGGEMLYGSDPAAPFRELIQNALDASDALEVRRRSKHAPAPHDPIEIEVEARDENAIQICIRDHGVGMTEYVLREVLPDFGRSIWSTVDEGTDAAYLLQKGLKPRGRFGIGFYSIFMIARQVRIATKPEDDSPSHALTFEDGLEYRPLLTRLSDAERARLGASGTEITFTLRDDLDRYQFHEMIQKPESIYDVLRSQDKLTKFLAMICPVANRRMKVRVNDAEPSWIESAALEEIKQSWSLFNARILGGLPEDHAAYQHCRFLFDNVQEVRDSEDTLLGIVAPNIPDKSMPLSATGIIVDGGIKVQAVPTFFGMAYGTVQKADRSSAISLLGKISATSEAAFAAHFKALLAIKEGKCDLRSARGVGANKDLLIAELLPLDSEFAVGLAAKRLKGSGNDRLSEWTALLRRWGRLIFYVPEATPEEIVQMTGFPFAYVMPSLPVWSRSSLLCHEFKADCEDQSIAKWLQAHFTAALSREVKYRFGRLAVGKIAKDAYANGFGMSFRIDGKDEIPSPAEEAIFEMVKLNAETIDRPDL
jgi:Histidine kinase-, DNA gyrase B-, and HSP90-like ATPase